MESVSLRRQPVVLIDNKRVGLLLEETDRVYSTLLYGESSFSGHVFAKETKTVEFLTGMVGRMGVLEVLFERKLLNAATMNVNDFTLGVTKDMIEVVTMAAEHGYTWRVGVPVACALQRRQDWVYGIFTKAEETVPDLIRAACLPYIHNEELERQFIGRMHSRRWPEALTVPVSQNEPRFLATRATAAAYVFARERGIGVDDPEGLTHIRQEALVGELVSSRRIPWIEPGLDAL